MKHDAAARSINTTESYKLRNEYQKAITDFEKEQKKFNKDTAKIIKVFNESLGPSARMLIKNYLLENKFREAWLKMDEYYNTQEEIDTSGLINYLTNVQYNPNTDGTLERYIGNLNNVFMQLNAAGNPLTEVNKLGIVRSSIKKGTNRYNQTLELCEFTRLGYQETLDKLHDQDVKYSMERYGDSSSNKKVKRENENLHNTEDNNININDNKSNSKSKFKGSCYICGKIGHKSTECRRLTQVKCSICGRANHKTDNCFYKDKD
jgi:hypothetical protein